MRTVPLTHQRVTIQDDFDLDKILESGQCFRPRKLADRALPLRFRQSAALSDPAGLWAVRRLVVRRRLGCLGRIFRFRPQLRRPAAESGGPERLSRCSAGLRAGHPGAASGPVGDARHLHHLPAQEHPGHPHCRRAAGPVLRPSRSVRRAMRSSSSPPRSSSAASRKRS